MTLVVIVIITFIVQSIEIERAAPSERAIESCELALETMKRIPVVIHAVSLSLEVAVPRTAPVFIEGSRCAVLVSDDALLGREVDRDSQDQ